MAGQDQYFCPPVISLENVQNVKLDYMDAWSHILSLNLDTRLSNAEFFRNKTLFIFYVRLAKNHVLWSTCKTYHQLINGICNRLGQVPLELRENDLPELRRVFTKLNIPKQVVLAIFYEHKQFRYMYSGTTSFLLRKLNTQYERFPPSSKPSFYEDQIVFLAWILS